MARAAHRAAFESLKLFLIASIKSVFKLGLLKLEKNRCHRGYIYYFHSMMKKRLVPVLLALLGLSTSLFSQEKIKWYSLSEALTLARTEPRVLVIDVYTDWCGWCKRMDATTFSDPGIVEMMNKHFYPVKLNAEAKEELVIGDRSYRFVDSGSRGYHELAAIVTKGRLSYPTISYMDAQGRVLQTAPGYRGAEQFRVYLEYYSEGSYRHSSFEDYVAGKKAASPKN